MRANGWRRLRNLLAVTWIVAALAAVAFYYFNAKRVISVAVGPGDPASMAAIARVFSDERSLIKLKLVRYDGLAESAKALEDRAVDMAVIRSDIALPTSGLTVAILRRDSIFLIVPPSSTIETFKDLGGHRVGLIAGLPDDEKLLDGILKYYAVSKPVGRQQGTPDDLAAALKKKQIQAVFGVGPNTRGAATEAYAAVARGMKAAPDIVGIEEAEAVARQMAALESSEIPKGTFSGAPARPEEDLTTLSVAYRLMARRSLPEVTAAEVARVILLAKSRLAGTPPAVQIEAPDAEKGAVFPVHQGAAAYYNGEQTSWFDRFESIFWIATSVLGLMGAALAGVAERLRRKRRLPSTSAAAEQLLALLAEARRADAGRLMELDAEADEMLSRALELRQAGEIDTERFNDFSIVLNQVRQAIEARRRALGPQAVGV